MRVKYFAVAGPAFWASGPGSLLLDVGRLRSSELRETLSEADKEGTPPPVKDTGRTVAVDVHVPL